jgi:hypothetical protein
MSWIVGGFSGSRIIPLSPQEITSVVYTSTLFYFVEFGFPAKRDHELDCGRFFQGAE